VIEQLLQADRLLAVDQVDAAEAIYRRVAELDPMDAIAVVGLARCALARGDDRRAYELASRALGIDPANDMARRMEARLSEILETRGEPVVRPAATTSASGMPMRPVTTPDAPAAPASPIARRGLLDRLRGR
jgi:tetratricopeptide (TPR) repeat protein